MRLQSCSLIGIGNAVQEARDMRYVIGDSCDTCIEDAKQIADTSQQKHRRKCNLDNVGQSIDMTLHYALRQSCCCKR